MKTTLYIMLPIVYKVPEKVKDNAVHIFCWSLYKICKLFEMDIFLT